MDIKWWTREVMLPLWIDEMWIFYVINTLIRGGIARKLWWATSLNWINCMYCYKALSRLVSHSNFWPVLRTCNFFVVKNCCDPHRMRTRCRNKLVFPAVLFYRNLSTNYLITIKNIVWLKSNEMISKNWMAKMVFVDWWDNDALLLFIILVYFISRSVRVSVKKLSQWQTIHKKHERFYQ